MVAAQVLIKFNGIYQFNPGTICIWRYLHSLNPVMYHRNLKGTNIMLSIHGTVKISDIATSVAFRSKPPPRGFYLDGTQQDKVRTAA